MELINADGKVWTTTQSGTTRIPHAFTVAGVAVCRKNIKPARFGHFFTLDEVRASTVMEAPCLNCQRKVVELASRAQKHADMLNAEHAEAVEMDTDRWIAQVDRAELDKAHAEATEENKARTDLVDDTIRADERVSFVIRRTTINATATTLVDEHGRIGIVVDGDQTGQVRYLSREHLTKLAPDMDALHTSALAYDEARSLLRDFAVLTSGTRVQHKTTGRLGTVLAETGKVTIPERVNFGRTYTDVRWDEVAGDMGLNRRSRPFVDEVQLVPACIHGNTPGPDVQGDPITACRNMAGGEEFGAFNDEGCVYAYDCAVDVANDAAKENEAEDAPAGDPSVTWALMCTSHAEQPAGTCEGCNAADDADENDTDEDDES